MINEKSLKNLQRGGPGRKKGSYGGRSKCLDTLDKMLSKAKNQKALLNKLQVMFDNDPSNFLLKYVYPVLPKDFNMKLSGDKDNPIIQEHHLKFGEILKNMNDDDRRLLREIFKRNSGQQ